MSRFIGQIALFPYTFTPNGWMPCEGQIIRIAENSALFSALGTQFGGDGRTTFALPDYRSLAPANSRYFLSITGEFPQRAD
jgi:microcystin-dependent protein